MPYYIEDVQDVFRTPFSPDLVLPEQFYPTAHMVDRPIRALMHAVLHDAINCISKATDPKNANLPHRSRVRRQAKEDVEWMRSNEDDWPFSFLRICDALGFDAEAVRQNVCNGKAQKPAGRHTVCRHNGKMRK